MVKKANIPHGFSIANIAIIILLGLIFWGTYKKVAPGFQSDSQQLEQLVVTLNSLQHMSGSCVVHPLARTIECKVNP